MYKEISIKEIEGFQIGNTENQEAATGCTVILADPAAVTGLDIRGGGPASRESALLNPTAANNGVHAVLLSGGSAFGLDAASGVVQYLEEHGKGFPTGYGVVPIVCASCLFDIGLVTAKVRPDKEMGYQACLNAEKNNYQDGNYGAGTGATVGKVAGGKMMMNSGIGSYAIEIGDFRIGAIVAVNAFGDIFDHKTAQKLAGVIDYETKEFQDCEELMVKRIYDNLWNEHENTTIGAIITNGKFTKSEMNKIAQMAHDGYGRAIRPVHTGYDGDSIYAMTAGTVPFEVNTAGALAATVMAEAIANAVRHTEHKYDLLCASDLK